MIENFENQRFVQLHAKKFQQYDNPNLNINYDYIKSNTMYYNSYKESSNLYFNTI